MTWLEEDNVSRGFCSKLCLGYLCFTYIAACHAHGVCTRKAFP